MLAGSSLLNHRLPAAASLPSDEQGFGTYRGAVVLYAAALPVYFSYRWCCSIAWERQGVREYQAFVCACEVYGALCVLLLGVLRFRRPWASQQPLPPTTDGAESEMILGGDDVRSFEWQGPFDVSVLIPCCKEPDELIFGTVRAALALHHPLAWRLRVFLLDDGGMPRRADALARLASGLGYEAERAQYVSRPNDPSVPRHGKSGNLNYALRTAIFADGERPPADAVLVVFDCDQEPHADFLAHTLPYLHTQPRVALVQTPQHFYNVVPSGDVFNHHNGAFFYAVQPGLDAWEATVCCGTNFVARAEAVHRVGWFPVESITEDFLLSMKLAAQGLVVRYHAATLVTGEAPEDLRQVFKQRSRWCCGCFQVFLHPRTPRLLLALRPMQAIAYLNAPLGYLGTVLTLPVWLVVPVLSLCLGVHPVQQLTPAFIVCWCLYYALLVTVCDMLPPRLNRHLCAFTASKANALFWHCYAKALLSALVGALLPSKQMTFQPTDKRGFSADASLRRAAPPPPACALASRRTAAREPLATAPGCSSAETTPLAAAPPEPPADADADAAADAAGEDEDEDEGPAPRDTSQADVGFHAAALLTVLVVLGVSLPASHVAGTSRLAMLSAVWLLLNALPMALPLAYALLPHNHRLHQKAIRAAWVSHSALTCVVAVLLLQHLVLCERRHSPLLEGAYNHECTNL